jgi:hypothetical protein
MRIVLAVTGGRDLTPADFEAGLAKLANKYDVDPRTAHGTACATFLGMQVIGHGVRRKG